jgi:hypothetical protein
MLAIEGIELVPVSAIREADLLIISPTVGGKKMNRRFETVDAELSLGGNRRL